MSTILLVDDEDTVLHAMSKALRRAGHDVAVARNAEEALASLARTSFDTIVSDIRMPGLSGLELLQEVRRRDLDVPVVLMTGDPGIDTAIAAVNLGAFQYLQKPFDPAQLLAIVDRAWKMYALAQAKRLALELAGDDEALTGDASTLPRRFQSALDMLWMAFQPIVSLSERRIIAYEALLRTDEPTLRSAPAFIAAAERVLRVHDLGRTVRDAVA